MNRFLICFYLVTFAFNIGMAKSSAATHFIQAQEALDLSEEIYYEYDYTQTTINEQEILTKTETVETIRIQLIKKALYHFEYIIEHHPKSRFTLSALYYAGYVALDLNDTLKMQNYHSRLLNLSPISKHKKNMKMDAALDLSEMHLALGQTTLAEIEMKIAKRRHQHRRYSCGVAYIEYKKRIEAIELALSLKKRE